MNDEILKIEIKNAVRQALARNAGEKSKRFFVKLPGHDPANNKQHTLDLLMRVSRDGTFFQAESTKVTGNTYSVVKKQYPIAQWDALIASVKAMGGVER